MNIFYHLIHLVKPDDINQTNISCINTSLILLIIEHDNNKLIDFLNVRFYLIKNIRNTFSDSMKVLENYKNLLIIWKQFYNYRPKDCSSLEHSTTIKFKKWYEVTDILLDENKDKQSSLYYLYNLN